jgi:aryl-alcohol dehydrogenase-like predicted oxidoreductase
MVEIPDKRPIGRSGIAIMPLMFGGNVFGWTVDERTAFTLLDAFVGAGFDAIDTADTYSIWIPGHVGGESERIIGSWLKARRNRNRVVIATKCGKDMGRGKQGLSKRYIKQAAEDSLKRLQTEYIDLYQAHAPDPKTPIAETLEAFGELIAEGKVRAIGASNYSAGGLQAALETSAKKGLASYECLQPRYNLYDRAEYEAEFADLVREERIGVIPFYSLAAGFLSGKYRSEADLAKSARGGKVRSDYFTPRGFRILAALDEVAAAYGVTPAAVALAWLMAQPGITAPIASVTSLAQLKDFTTAIRLELGDYAMDKLDSASRPDTGE